MDHLFENINAYYLDLLDVYNEIMNSSLITETYKTMKGLVVDNFSVMFIVEMEENLSEPLIVNEEEKE